MNCTYARYRGALYVTYLVHWSHLARERLVLVFKHDLILVIGLGLEVTWHHPEDNAQLVQFLTFILAARTVCTKIIKECLLIIKE